MRKTDIVIGIVDDTIDRFWELIQERIPEIQSGILFKHTQSYHRFHLQCQKVVNEWIKGEGWSK